MCVRFSVSGYASRPPKKAGDPQSCLFAGLDHRDILTLMGEPRLADEATIMRAYAHFYDQRGGGIETSFSEDKSGLGITKRNKTSSFLSEPRR